MADFLESQLEVGQQLAEDEHFTISPELAWEKMATHAFSFSEAWVLQLVRGAVLARCHSLRVVQEKSLTFINLNKLQPWNSEAFADALFSFEHKGEKAYRHIALGLRFLSKTLGNPFLLKIGDDLVCQWDGEKLETEPQEVCLPCPRSANQGQMTLVVKNSKSTSRSFFSKLFRSEEREFNASVSRILHNRAFCAPVDLLLDSRRIQGLHHHPFFAPSGRCRPLLQFQEETSEGLPGFSLGQPLQCAKLDRNNPIWITSSELPKTTGADVNEDLGLACLLVAYLDKEKRRDSMLLKESRSSAWIPSAGPSVIAWVQDGVVVEEEPITGAGCFGLLVVVSAEGLKTDLSGYHLVREQDYFVRRELALSRMARLILDRFQEGEFEHKQSQLFWNFDFVFRGIVAAAGLVFVIPGLLMLADLAYGSSVARKLHEKSRREFEQEFQSLLVRLKAYL